jgi:HAD superfamily hydrolase (TIGR01509 family)
LSYKDILPGIVEILDTLKKQGIKTAIASASRNALYILEQIELSEFFDVIVPSEDVGVGKPDPEIFARAAFLLGLYPEECTGVEDAPPGITAIKAAMMRSVGVGSAIDPESCDVYVDSTANLTAEMLLF